MYNIQIEKVKTSNLEALRNISIHTFTEAFSKENTEENITKYILEAMSMEKLQNEVNDSNAAFFFCKDDEKIIGYLKLNFGTYQKEGAEFSKVEIERIYVLKEFYGKNVAQKLMDKSIEIARKQNAEYIWLGVWEKNQRAISFYTKNDFVAFDTYTFMLGDDAQTDIIMKLYPK